MQEELKHEGPVPVLDDEVIEKLLQADLRQTLRNEEQAAAQAQEGLSYQRSDGTVMHAENAETAIRLCPVLGKMALEDPEKANALLMLAEIDDEDFDFFDEPPEQYVEKVRKENEPVAAIRPVADIESQVHAVEEARHPASVAQELTPDIQADQVVQKMRQEIELNNQQTAIIEQTDSIVPASEEPVAPQPAEAQPVDQQITDEGEMVESLATIASDETQPIREATSKVGIPKGLSRSEDITPNAASVAHPEKINHKNIFHEQVDQPQLVSTLRVKQIDKHSVAPVAVPRQDDIKVKVEIQQAEVSNVAEVGTKSVSPIAESVIVAQIDTVPDVTSEQDNSPISAELSQVLPALYESPDQAVTRPQEIVERIETAQLDDILADVGRFVSLETTFETDENTIEAAVKVEEVQAVIQDIELLLNKIDNEIIDSTEKDLIDSLLQDPAIKQELVEKVMHLFRTLGYEQPDAQVRQLLDSYDTIFLKQSLENMCQMANGSKKLGRMFADGSDRQVRVSQYLATYIKQLMSQQLLQTFR